MALGVWECLIGSARNPGMQECGIAGLQDCRNAQLQGTSSGVGALRVSLHRTTQRPVRRCVATVAAAVLPPRRLYDLVQPRGPPHARGQPGTGANARGWAAWRVRTLEEGGRAAANTHRHGNRWCNRTILVRIDSIRIAGTRIVRVHLRRPVPPLSTVDFWQVRLAEQPPPTKLRVVAQLQDVEHREGAVVQRHVHFEVFEAAPRLLAAEEAPHVRLRGCATARLAAPLARVTEAGVLQVIPQREEAGIPLKERVVGFAVVEPR